MMRAPFWVWWLPLLLVLQAAGCGFHLRGNAQIPQHWNPIFVDAGNLTDEQLGRIRSALTRASARLSTQAESSTRLSVNIHSPQSRLLASSSVAGVEIRQLGMQLDYQLQSSSGKMLIDQQQMVQNAEIELDTGNLLANQELIEQGTQRLQDKLIHSMIFQLSHQ